MHRLAGLGGLDARRDRGGAPPRRHVERRPRRRHRPRRPAHGGGQGRGVGAADGGRRLEPSLQRRRRRAVAGRAGAARRAVPPALPRGRAAAGPLAGRRSPRSSAMRSRASTSTRRSSAWCARRWPATYRPCSGGRGRTRSMTGRSRLAAAAPRRWLWPAARPTTRGRRASAPAEPDLLDHADDPRPQLRAAGAPDPGTRARAPCRRRGSAPGHCRCGRTATARPSRRRPSSTRAGSRCRTRSRRCPATASPRWSRRSPPRSSPGPPGLPAARSLPTTWPTCS